MVGTVRWAWLACAVALSCGGESREGGASGGLSGAIGDGGGPSGGAGGKGGATTGGATGGTWNESGGTGVAIGGADSSGGAGAGTGGSAASTGGAPVFDPSTAGCQPSQWRCPTPPTCAHDLREGFVVPSDCHCDPSLPVDVACATNEKLICLRGSENSTRQSIRDVTFGCHCVPAETTCRDCAHVFANREAHCDASAEVDATIICGCLYVDPM